MFELHHLSASEQIDWVRRGDIAPVELVEHYLRRIERFNGELGAFVTVHGERALDRARMLGASEARSAVLFGLPFADKDLVRRAGQPAGFGSRLMSDHVPEESDPMALVLDDAGGISLGATATPEFGLPSYTETLVGPPARNPYDLARGAGGSSGGAAVAVAAGLLPVAPGSDGGGSIRIPAAATGLVGLKPSRGLVPAGSGVDALGGLPVHGPLARSVADAGLLLEAMLGRVNGRIPHRHTLRAPEDPGGSYLAAAVRGEGRFQIAISRSTPWPDDYEIAIDPEAEAALRVAADGLAAMGHGVEERDLEHPSGYDAAFRVIWQAGAASLPAETEEQLALLEPLTRWLVGRGRELSARTLAQALAALAAYERRIVAQLADVDAVLTPALAMTPRPLGWYDSRDPERNFRQQVAYTPFTSFVNVSGLPAITLPVHVTAEGLPMGAQLIGRPGGEAVLLALGAQLERRLHWQWRHPPQW